MFLRKNEEERDVIHNCVISKGHCISFSLLFWQLRALQSKKTGFLDLLYLIYRILSNKILYTVMKIIIVIRFR